MSEELEVGCVRPAGGPAESSAPEEDSENSNNIKPIAEVQSMIKVGQKAPDFTASGYQKGKFVSTTLSDNIGKWVVLCFYPGDFTFV